MPGGNRIPPRSASVRPSAESRSRIATEKPRSVESRSSRAFACSQKAQSSRVSKRTSTALRLRLAKALGQIGQQGAGGHVHDVAGSSPIVGPPGDAAVGAHDDEAVAVPAVAHHAVAVRAVGAGDGQLGIGEYGGGEALVGDSLAE